ncbi:hypothetical protein GDO86_014211 [Hymenochirus boettgeri]|uniref:Uncharacterized protein n=1 Tax=Hymenochirus boettgeri TaxID=247094 RepID=A0A8T2JTC3_9PIPI|nr:hypothetical protein GDO86_014211 [Hymenochirus boettgeri]
MRCFNWHGQFFGKYVSYKCISGTTLIGIHPLKLFPSHTLYILLQVCYYTSSYKITSDSTVKLISQYLLLKDNINHSLFRCTIGE